MNRCTQTLFWSFFVAFALCSSGNSEFDNSDSSSLNSDVEFILKDFSLDVRLDTSEEPQMVICDGSLQKNFVEDAEEMYTVPQTSASLLVGMSGEETVYAPVSIEVLDEDVLDVYMVDMFGEDMLLTSGIEEYYESTEFDIWFNCKKPSSSSILKFTVRLFNEGVLGKHNIEEMATFYFKKQCPPSGMAVSMCIGEGESTCDIFDNGELNPAFSYESPTHEIPDQESTTVFHLSNIGTQKDSLYVKSIVAHSINNNVKVSAFGDFSSHFILGSSDIQFAVSYACQKPTTATIFIEAILQDVNEPVQFSYKKVCSEGQNHPMLKVALVLHNEIKTAFENGKYVGGWKLDSTSPRVLVDEGTKVSTVSIQSLKTGETFNHAAPVIAARNPKISFPYILGDAANGGKYLSSQTLDISYECRRKGRTAIQLAVPFIDHEPIIIVWNKECPEIRATQPFFYLTAMNATIIGFLFLATAGILLFFLRRNFSALSGTVVPQIKKTVTERRNKPIKFTPLE